MTTTPLKPIVHGMFDPATWTVTYVVYEKPGSACAIIDSVLDYDPKSGRTSHTSADKVIDFVKANDLKVAWILETHAHADHLSAAPYLQERLGGKIGIGDRITVNWVYKPYLDVRARRYRFRILNGSVSRYYQLALVNQIGQRVPFQAHPVHGGLNGAVEQFSDHHEHHDKNQRKNLQPGLAQPEGRGGTRRACGAPGAVRGRHRRGGSDGGRRDRTGAARADLRARRRAHTSTATTTIPLS